MSNSFADYAGDEQDGIERAEARAEEEVRERYWTEFETTCSNFAADFGWHGVLNAIARAMQEEANARAKAEVAAQSGVA